MGVTGKSDRVVFPFGTAKTLFAVKLSKNLYYLADNIYITTLSDSKGVVNG